MAFSLAITSILSVFPSNLFSRPFARIGAIRVRLFTPVDVVIISASAISRIISSSCVRLFNALTGDIFLKFSVPSSILII